MTRRWVGATIWIWTAHPTRSRRRPQPPRVTPLPWLGRCASASTRPTVDPAPHHLSGQKGPPRSYSSESRKKRLGRPARTDEAAKVVSVRMTNAVPDAVMARAKREHLDRLEAAPQALAQWAASHP